MNLSVVQRSIVSKSLVKFAVCQDKLILVHCPKRVTTDIIYTRIDDIIRDFPLNIYDITFVPFDKRLLTLAKPFGYYGKRCFESPVGLKPETKSSFWRQRVLLFDDCDHSQHSELPAHLCQIDVCPF